MAEQEGVEFQEPAQPVDAAAGPENATEDAEHWKRMSRQNERDKKALAKANAEMAKRLEQVENASKSEEQIRSERAVAAEQERDALRAELTRLRIAARYGIGEDDLDLLGAGEEDEIEARAKRVAELSAAAAALAAPSPSVTRRPVESMRPGASPSGDMPLNGDPIVDALKNTLGIT